MSERHDPDVTLPWMRDGTRRFLAAVESLEDREFAHPSGLPGWSRAHVIGHVAGNADALIRLTSWADTGVECPMYESREQRNSEIESTAAMTPDELRRLSVDTAAALDRALAGLDERGWTATVRSALGRVIPAAEIPWMRIREVWLHAIDIGGGRLPGTDPGPGRPGSYLGVGPRAGERTRPRSLGRSSRRVDDRAVLARRPAGPSFLDLSGPGSDRPWI